MASSVGAFEWYNGASTKYEGDRALKVTVRLFAGHRERAGRSVVELELPDGATVGSLAEEVVRRYPAVALNSATLVTAVNHEFRQHNHVLNDGDEAALIPPVSGGARPTNVPSCTAHSGELAQYGDLPEER